MVQTLCAGALAAALAAASSKPIPLPPPPDPREFAQPERPAPPPAAAPRTEAAPERWWLSLSATEGHWTDEIARDAAPVSAVGLGVTWRFARAQALSLDGEFQSYRRTYVSTRVDPVTGSAPSVDAGERRFSGDLRYRYELLHHLGSERTRLDVQLGAGWHQYEDRVVRATVAPVGGGFRLARAFPGDAEAFVDAFFGWNAVSEDPGADSVAGAVLASHRWSTGVAWRLAPGLRAEVAYRGEALVLKYGVRQEHGLGLAFALGF